MADEPRAVLLDALGTLLRLVPPAPALARALGVEERDAERAFRAEVGYYLAHHLEGRDPESLNDLRGRCAAVFADALGLPFEEAAPALFDAIRFEAYPDVPDALELLRPRRLVVCSNWDCSLPDVLAEAGIEVDAVVTSAGAGAAKPDPRIFEAALAAAGCRADEAVHIGDSPENDGRGAEAAGIRAIVLRRDEGRGLSAAAASLISSR